MVVQGECQSSCATVLMPDCSHSMSLDGEDRSPHPSRCAGAAQLNQDACPRAPINSCCSTIPPRRIRARRLGRVRVGPVLHNTVKGARLSRRISTVAQGHCARSSESTDGTVGVDTQPTADLQERLRPSIRSSSPKLRRGPPPAARAESYQHFMAGRAYDLSASCAGRRPIFKGSVFFTTPYTLGHYS